MVNSRHLKRHSTPKAWGVKRKGISYITRPNPGAHKKEYSTPLLVLLRDILGYVKTQKGGRALLRTQEVLLNGKKVTDLKAPCGLFDVLEIKSTKEKLRLIFDEYGVFKLIPAKKDDLYLKVSTKTALSKGKYQLGFTSGYSLICSEKEFKSVSIADTVIVDSSKKKITSIINFKEGNFAYIVDGTFQSSIAKIKSITKYNGLAKDVVEIEIGKDVKTTSKDYCFIIGSKKEDLGEFN